MSPRRAGDHCDVDLVHWSRYLEGEFSSAKCRRCEIHLASCATCRKKLRDVRQTVQASHAAARQPLPPAVKRAIRQRAKAAVAAGRKGTV